MPGDAIFVPDTYSSATFHAGSYIKVTEAHAKKKKNNKMEKSNKNAKNGASSR